MSFWRRLFGGTPAKPPRTLPSLNLNIPPTAFADPPRSPAPSPIAKTPPAAPSAPSPPAVMAPLAIEASQDQRQGSETGATAAQLKAIEDFYGAPPDSGITRDHASMALTVRDYVSAVATLSIEAGKPVSMSAMRVVSARILGEPINCKTLRGWNSRRFSRGTHSDAPRLTANRLFMRVLFDLHRADADIERYLSEVR